DRGHRRRASRYSGSETVATPEARIMTLPGFGGGGPSIAERRTPGVKELNIGDQWRALFVDDELPPELEVTHAYVVVVKGERGYLLRRRGEGGNWTALEVEAEKGERIEDAIERVVGERMNGKVA